MYVLSVCTSLPLPQMVTSSGAGPQAGMAHWVGTTASVGQLHH